MSFPRGHNPCIFTNDSERRVAITRKYAGIRVLAHHDFQFWRFSDFLAFLLLFFLAKNRRDLRASVKVLLFGPS